MEFIIFAILILLAIGTLVYGIGVLVLGGWPYCAAIALAGIIVAIIGAVSAKKSKTGQHTSMKNISMRIMPIKKHKINMSEM